MLPDSEAVVKGTEVGSNLRDERNVEGPRMALFAIFPRRRPFPRSFHRGAAQVVANNRSGQPFVGHQSVLIV